MLGQRTLLDKPDLLLNAADPLFDELDLLPNEHGLLVLARKTACLRNELLQILRLDGLRPNQVCPAIILDGLLTVSLSARVLMPLQVRGAPIDIIWVVGVAIRNCLLLAVAFVLVGA